MQIFNYIKLILILLLLFVKADIFAQTNEDFESYTTGSVPTGWTISGTASTGDFEIGAPTQRTNSGVITQLAGDHTPAPGVNALFTAPNVSDGNEDVDGGTATVTSPTYTVTSASTLSIWYFFGQRDFNDDPGDDFFLLEYSINNGASYTDLVSIGDVRINAVWTEATVAIPAGSNVRIRVSAADGAGPGDLIEAGIDDITITPNVPVISINDVSVNENAGTLDFTVTHSGGDLSGGFTIEYSTANNTALSSQDYTATGAPNPTISFTGLTASNPTETISIPITDDNFVEGAETFFVNLSNPSDSSVTFADSQGQGTINANDPASLSIDDVTVNEGDGTATFTVSLSGNTDSGFTVEYSTTNGSALAGSDYTGTSAPTPTISFTGNSLNETQQITIPIIDDSDVEADHNFFVNLGTVSNGLITISDGTGEATIEDNDAGISIADLTTIGEASGTATFVVTHIGADVPGGFTVNFSSANNTATAPGDYTATSSPPAISFSGTSGETQNIPVTIIDDLDIEGNESFFINLTSVSNPLVSITDNQAEGIIIDDEIPFIITDGVTDNTCSGVFTDTGGLNGNYSDNEGITYTLCPDTPGSVIVLDFTAFNVENFFDGLSIYQGTTTTTLIDTFDNDNIPRQIISTDASGCLTFVFTSDFTVNDDGWEANISCASVFLNVSNVTVNEAAGTATFAVTLNGNVPGGFTVDYVTDDGTALADSDYTTTTGTLNFLGNDTESFNVTVPIINNTFAENDEIFYLTLNNVSNSSVGLIEGIGTITDDVGDTVVNDDVPLTLFDEFNGYYDYALTGGSLRTASDAVDPCDIADSSSNTLTTTIPAGSTIDKAYLLWAHAGPSADDVVVFEGQNVTAEVINSTNGGTFYGMVGDVTSIINGITDPSTNTFDFTGLTVDNRTLCAGTVVIGGWSLMIFYTNPAFPAVGINMYNGFDLEGGGAGSTTTYTLGGFYAIGAAGSKTSVLSWEGDQGIAGTEEISLTVGANNTTLNGDGDNTGGTQNLFNSTIYDNTVLPVINDTSVFGLDLDTYDVSALIGPGETSATTEVTTGGDVVILNTVLLKVPSNLITGNVFEDINYPGGQGRTLATASGAGINAATVELYRETSPGVFALEETTTTDSTGEYTFGGMADGTYRVRVVNNTVRSTRGGGTACTSCIPIQTFRVDYASGGTFTNQLDEVGGADPTATDVGTGTLTGAQTVSSVTINGEGVVGLDFGFNFNTIVNTNEDGQGSLDQFIINANTLDETGLDIQAHPNDAALNPAAGEDTSIFMIPTNADALGRTVDPNYIVADGYFDIIISNGSPLTILTSDNTKIDARTQTAYSGDTNTGVVGSGGALVGVSATTLPDYNLPEIQVRSDFGDVLQLQGSNNTIRNLAVYGGNRRAIVQISGSDNLISSNLLGVNALGVLGTVGVGSYVDDGVEVRGGTSIIDSNYIASNTDFGVVITGGTSTIIRNNHFTGNGYRSCDYNINIQGGSGVVISTNLIENSEATGINDDAGSVIITENTITGSGANTGGGCTEISGIELTQNNSTVTSNVINNNAGAGIIVTGGNTSGNRISQNSIFANGTTTPSLGIDINNDGVTINDNNDSDNGPNTTLNFPIIESATIRGTTLRITGWAGAGATVEFFLTDINQGTAAAGDNQIAGPSGAVSRDYGEGQEFIISAVEGSIDDTDSTVSNYPTDVDGNTDTTNRFDFRITLGTTIPRGSMLTATATVANSTSEFGNGFMVTAATVITNRRITYRVTARTPIAPTGTLTSDLSINTFADGQFGAGNPYQLQVQNTTATPFNYEIWIENVPYSTIPGLNLGNHTLQTSSNGDGTFNFLFTSTTALGAFQTTIISGSGGAPSPPGTGPACGCVSFYKL
ncbi:sodium:calcium exchanger [Aquimarina sp. AD10]|uniref:beta strand repeat-containing protein n=1 Tax=Aquimarina sp. AD10 TaxID=1714849 RepID=UPI000E5074EC|nr:Calx-beta domain-containing protein [Aquimarina sp. AD10]AXT60803.1 sodium:calcium exchanger [Aquimarina sp. AD10]RKM98497.1 sodium:calcium exchanger [Aquimarina sp. AD10]